MKQAFHMGYKQRDKVFYLSSMSSKGEEQNVFLHSGTWDEHWVVENKRFEKVLREDLDLVRFSNKIFFVWDMNHHI